MAWRHPTLVVTAFFFQVPSPCFFLDTFCVLFSSIAFPFPLQDNSVEAVGMLCSFCLHSYTNVVRRSISYVSRYLRPAFYLLPLCILPSQHPIVPWQDPTQVYCASGGFRMCFSVLLSEFFTGVNMSFSLYAFVPPNCKLGSPRETLAVLETLDL